MPDKPVVVGAEITFEDFADDLATQCQCDGNCWPVLFGASERKLTAPSCPLRMDQEDLLCRVCRIAEGKVGNWVRA